MITNVNYTIKIICRDLSLKSEYIYENIFRMRQKLFQQLSDEDLEDLLMETYCKIKTCNVDQKKNINNLFVFALRNTIYNFYKIHNRYTLFSSLDNIEDTDSYDNLLLEGDNIII